MAIDLKYFIKGQPSGTPKNASEIKLISNWTDATLEDKSEAEVSTNTLQFALEDATKINNHVAGGLAGQGGIFEGLPYKINYKNIITGATGNLLDGYIDLTDEALFISCDEVEANIKKNRNLDWLTEQADSFSFTYLTSINVGIITDADFVEVPVVLNYRPDAFAVMMIKTSIFMLLRETYQIYRNILADIGTIYNFDFVEGFAALTADLIYLGAVLKSLYELIKELIDQIIPPTRVYKGMLLKTMFEKGCEYLDLDFKSTIFDEKKWQEIVYMPTKSIGGKVGGGTHPFDIEKGCPNANSAVYNFGDFLRTMKQMFNAQIKIEGRALRFERKDYWDSKASYNLPDVETDQDRRLTTFRYNTNELNSNYLISFQTDPVDENTLDNFEGTNFQAIIVPDSLPSNPQHVNIKGLAEVRLPFALGTRKFGRTPLELLAMGMTVIMDTLVLAGITMVDRFTKISLAYNALQALGALPPVNINYTTLTGQITKREGHLLLSQDATGVDKLLTVQFNRKNNFIIQAGIDLYNAMDSIIRGLLNTAASFGGSNVNFNASITDQASLDFTTITAKQLWSHYHCINSFAPDTVDFRASMQQNKWITANNQGKLYEGVEIPFCEQDWLNLQTNNRFNTADRKVGEILRIEWDIQNDKAIVDYKVKEVYTNNLKIEYNEGQ
jgi:hypothetical protein